MQYSYQFCLIGDNTDILAEKRNMIYQLTEVYKFRNDMHWAIPGKIFSLLVVVIFVVVICINMKCNILCSLL